MDVFLDGRRTEKPEPAALRGASRLICLAPLSHRGQAEGIPGLPRLDEPAQRDAFGPHFESRDGYDYLRLAVPRATRADEGVWNVWVYMTDRVLTVLYEDGLPAADEVCRKLCEEREGADAFSPPAALLFFLGHLMQKDTAALEAMEEEISDLEDAMLQRAEQMPAESISALRRRLLWLKRYYEAMFDLLEDMEENANGFIGEKQMRALHLLTNRADRLSHWVLNLRDYVTQVREAYQNQLDIGLNKTMKLFTMVATVFLPLTLVAGWYGMNLPMPEYSWPWAYPAVILFSLATLAASLLYFKKRKWF